MGIAHDPESASPDGNVFWAFDGHNGQLLRYDFERPHGGGTGYLSADHSEATVRRYEDVQLHRQPGVSSHMVVDGAHRDLYIADSAGRRVLRVDIDSGRRSRDARTEYPIYSSTDIRFDYSIWNCTLQEVLLSVDSLAAAGLADDALDFMASGIAVTETVLYVANYVTGRIIAVDKYSGAIIDSISTSRPNSVFGLAVSTTGLWGGTLIFSDASANQVIRLDVSPNSQCQPVEQTAAVVDVAWTLALSPSSISVMKGDSIRFSWTGAHNVYLMADKAAFEACNFQDATMLNGGAASPVAFSTTNETTGAIYFACSVNSHCASGQKLAVTINNTFAEPGSVRRAYPTDGLECAAPNTSTTLAPAISHDPGYMNTAIPYDYASNLSVPCHDASGRSNFNLDALLMAGHTCHRCLPEPCLNGGSCIGVQERGFTCNCSYGFGGDLCQSVVATNAPTYSVQTTCRDLKTVYQNQTCCGLNTNKVATFTSTPTTCGAILGAYRTSACCSASLNKSAVMNF